MFDKEVAVSLETLRQDELKLINSKEYRVGNKILMAVRDLKRMNIVGLLRRELKYRKIARYNYNSNLKNNALDFDYGEYPGEDTKFTVYTCITGGYDLLLDPLYKNDNIKYVAFTDSGNFRSNVWNVVQIPKEILKIGNNILINRFYKFHPHELFPDSDYALYLDGNLEVISDIRNMINRINPKTGLAFHRHNSRNCIYREAEVCRIEGRGNYSKIQNQLKAYRNYGFPEEYGLYEANIILTDIKNNEAKTILDSWWKEFNEYGSYRDQIALPYAVWKCGYKFEDIGNLGLNMHQNPKFKKISHNS